MKRFLLSSLLAFILSGMAFIGACLILPEVVIGSKTIEVEVTDSSGGFGISTHTENKNINVYAENWKGALAIAFFLLALLLVMNIIREQTKKFTIKMHAWGWGLTLFNVALLLTLYRIDRLWHIDNPLNISGLVFSATIIPFTLFAFIVAIRKK